MRNHISLFTLFVVLAACSSTKHIGNEEWISLFDGKSLDGWKVGSNAQTFTVQDGAIVVNGNVAHLFYDGPVQNHDFRNFEFKAEVMTFPGANSGIYFHTRFQENSWPKKGYEVQVNNSQSDWRRTGSLYGIQDIRETYVKDQEWFTEQITVKGKRITVRINDKVVMDYTEPVGVQREKGSEERVISSGTFALQGHDPGSKVLYRNIRVRVLQD